MPEFVDPFAENEKFAPVKLASVSEETGEEREKEKYVSGQVEITRAQFWHDENLAARLKRSRRYAEWRWDGFHTRNDGSRIPFGSPVKPIERRVGSL